MVKKTSMDFIVNPSSLDSRTEQAILDLQKELLRACDKLDYMILAFGGDINPRVQKMRTAFLFGAKVCEFAITLRQTIDFDALGAYMEKEQR